MKISNKFSVILITLVSLGQIPMITVSEAASKTGTQSTQGNSNTVNTASKTNTSYVDCLATVSAMHADDIKWCNQKYPASSTGGGRESCHAAMDAAQDRGNANCQR